jgi:hypothetical protein
VLIGTSKIPAFSGTTGDFGCGNFEAAAPKPIEHGRAFVTIWVGDRVVWQGPEDEIPASFRDKPRSADPDDQ